MKNDKCVKCGNNDVFENKYKTSQRSWTKISMLTRVRVIERICSQCGYIESYVEDVEKFREQLARVIKNGGKAAAR